MCTERSGDLETHTCHSGHVKFDADALDALFEIRLGATPDADTLDAFNRAASVARSCVKCGDHLKTRLLGAFAYDPGELHDEIRPFS